MYITVKKRENKKDISVFYLYVCESVRVEGKVKNTQRYFGSINETDLADDNLEVLDKAEETGKWKEDEVELVERKLHEIKKKL